MSKSKRIKKKELAYLSCLYSTMIATPFNPKMLPQILMNDKEFFCIGQKCRSSSLELSVKREV